MAFVVGKNGATFERAYMIGSTQRLLAAASAAQSLPVGASTYLLRIACEKPTFVVVGSAPLALVNSSTSLCIWAEGVEFVACRPGDRVAVLRNGGANGDVFVTEAWVV